MNEKAAERVNSDAKNLESIILLCIVTCAPRACDVTGSGSSCTWSLRSRGILLIPHEGGRGSEPPLLKHGLGIFREQRERGSDDLVKRSPQSEPPGQ